MADQNRNSSHRASIPLPVIMEEDAMMAPASNNPLQRTPGSMFVHPLSDDEDDILNTNSNRHSELNNNSEDSGGSDGETGKPKAMFGPRNIETGDQKLPEPTEETQDDALKAPTWDTMLAQLNKMPGDAILLVADVRAVMLAESHWNIPYPQALGHVLLAWQMLRSGCYMKDCRVWLRKRYKNKPFTLRQQPFKSTFGIAGFCIRRRRSAPEKDELTMEQRDERLKNNIIEYTAYADMKGKRFVRRINSKKDEKTERYKGKQWEELDKVILRWDNTGYHTSGSVQVSLDQELEGASLDLRRHASLPSNGHRRAFSESDDAAVFTMADCLNPAQKGFAAPPNKRVKRHNSDSTLCPGKSSHVWMCYNNQPGEIPTDKTSSEDLTKEELWNRAMAEVNCQNLTSSNNATEKNKLDARAPSPAASLASADWSVGSQQSSDSCDDNCNCNQCQRRLTASPGFFAPNANHNSDESISEEIEAEDTTGVVDDILDNSSFNLNINGTRFVHSRAENTPQPPRPKIYPTTEGFVNVNDDLVAKSCSGDSMDAEYVNVKVSPCSNTSEGFTLEDVEMLPANSDSRDK